MCFLQNKRDEHLLKRRNVPHEDICDDSDADGDFRTVRTSVRSLWQGFKVYEAPDRVNRVITVIILLSFSLLTIAKHFA